MRESSYAHSNFTDMCYKSRLLINKFNARGSGYELDRRFTKFSEITQSKGHYVVQCHSKSPILVVINTNLPSIFHRFQGMVKFSLARAECLVLTLSLGVIACQYRHK